MISQFFVHLAASVSGWVAGLFPTWDPPAALADPGSMIGGIMLSFVGLGPWVNWTVLGLVLGAVLSTWLVMAAIKLVRAVISYVPFFGGAG